MPGSDCINCRCSPKYFRNFVGGLGLGEPTLKLFRSTPFGHFLDVPPVCTERPLLDALLGSWDEECQHFRFGDSEVDFTSTDVALVLGLHKHGRFVDLESKSRRCSLWTKYFNNKVSKITRKDTEDILASIARDLSGSNIEDFTKILVLFFFQVVLFPLSSYTLSPGLVDYVDDLQELKGYGWAETVWENVLKEVRHGALAIKAREGGSKKAAGYFSGCSVVLRAWYFEHQLICQPASASDTYPRLWKWTSILHKQRKTIAYEFQAMKATDIVLHLSPRNDIEGNILQEPTEPTDALVALPEPMTVSSSDTEEDDAKPMSESDGDDESVDDATLVSRVIERTSAAKIKTVWRNDKCFLNLKGFEELVTPNKWLADDAIDSYGELMLQTQERGGVYTSRFDYVSVFAVDGMTPFGSIDLQNGNVDMVFMPLNARGQHWTLVVADLTACCFRLYDSMHRASHVPEAQQMVTKVISHFEGKGFHSVKEWPLIALETTIPQQDNSDDCGVFVLVYMDCLARGGTFTFSCKDINLLRMRFGAQFARNRII